MWWESFGAKCPLLQQLAIRILSQPCNASGCEHNWSLFEPRKRNRLMKERLDKLVFVNYNLSLLNRRIERSDGDPIDLDTIDQTNEWINSMDDWQNDILEGDGLERLEREVEKHSAFETESQDQPVSPSAPATSKAYGTRAATKDKGRGKKRADP